MPQNEFQKNSLGSGGNDDSSKQRANANFAYRFAEIRVLAADKSPLHPQRCPTVFSVDDIQFNVVFSNLILHEAVGCD